ncbi:uncharacterized protein YALI1_E21417g [Yarrowia lipolytica]|uniref:Uncharacterized protein n=1 Tax=Yarrowia lipolytica TaxID=4952 RepID=A0A1D8NIW5_YARLL|nr:hypothetical protein YALI1_E21417g [Yarrowia lipolytica]
MYCTVLKRNPDVCFAAMMSRILTTNCLPFLPSRQSNLSVSEYQQLSLDNRPTSPDLDHCFTPGGRRIRWKRNNAISKVMLVPGRVSTVSSGWHGPTFSAGLTSTIFTLPTCLSFFLIFHSSAAGRPENSQPTKIQESRLQLLMAIQCEKWRLCCAGRERR